MAKMIKCEVCGQMVDSRGLANHMKKHESNNDEKIEDAEVLEVDKKESLEKCIACGSKVICRLDDFIEKAKELGTVQVNQSELKKIYADGYTHVCGNCGEVLK